MKSKKKCIKNDPNCTQTGKKVSFLLQLPGAVCDKGPGGQGALRGRKALQGGWGRVGHLAGAQGGVQTYCQAPLGL